MIRGWIIDSRQQQFREIDSQHLKHWHDEKHPWHAREEGELLWIDLGDPGEEDFDVLAQRMELHPAVIDNLRQTEGRPKVQQFQKYFHVTAYQISRVAPGADEGNDDNAPVRETSCAEFGVRLREVDLLVGKDYVITMHQGELPAWKQLAKDWKSQPPRTEGGIAYVVYELLDSILEAYFPVLDDISDRIDELEDVLFTGNGHAVTSEIFALKRMLIRIRQVSSPMREVVGQLSRHYGEEKNNEHVYFQDLYDHAMRILDMLDSFRDILAGSMDVYLAAESNRMNEVMKTLTSFSIIFLLPTLIAGVYGMNFVNMPELHQPSGYAVCLGVIVISMVGAYAFFKRKKWI